MKKNTVSFVATIVVAIAVFAVAVGLPFAQFSLKSVSAQYSPSAAACARNAEEQIRFYGDVLTYADSGLTQEAILIPGAKIGKKLQKYLVCPGTVSDTHVQIYLAGTLVWVPAGSGEIVPRYFSDSQ